MKIFIDNPGFWLFVITISALLVIDRWALRRGSDCIRRCTSGGIAGDAYRFNVRYVLPASFEWASIKFSLTDKSDPATVINAQSRQVVAPYECDISEYIYIDVQDVRRVENYKEANWEIRTDAEIVSKYNPLYRFFPVRTSTIVAVTFDE